MKHRSVTGTSRRDFLRTASLAALTAGLAPRLLAQEGTPTASRFKNLVTGRPVRLAPVGVGGMGAGDVQRFVDAGAQLVALCDVDFNRAQRHFQENPTLPRYRDYRQMLAEMGDQIDAVSVTTPDHTHFGVAMLALELGKHVYVQKPLTHTVEEARLLKAAAARAGVVTQMGNQGHANEGTRLTKEWIDAGVIGTVREVHIWTDRPVWPQGIPLPERETAPSTLDWNLWLNVAPERPYMKDVAPFRWRGFWEYGCGALGDMGCHTMDAAFWALDLRGDVRITAESEGCNDVVGPKWSIVTYEFPQRGNRAPVKLVWYDGGKVPKRPEELAPDAQLSGTGSIYYGDKGVIYNPDTYNASPRLLPDERMQSFTDRPKRTIPRVPRSSPYVEFLMACRGEGPAPGSNIVDYSADMTEMVLLGNLAIRSGKPIEWNAAEMRCTNVPEANRFVRKSYRLF